MANRVAGILALVAFAMCLLVGCFEADNSFTTIVYRALIAMFWTYVVGYVIGIAAEKMLNEAGPEKNPASIEESVTDGR
jgi:NhaP-type Na+/H+ or K+/H+ antiporter